MNRTISRRDFLNGFAIAAIAHSDAKAFAYTSAAIDQASRAVLEVAAHRA